MPSSVQAAAKGDVESLLMTDPQFDDMMSVYDVDTSVAAPKDVDHGEWSQFAAAMAQNGVEPQYLTESFFKRWQDYNKSVAAEPN